MASKSQALPGFRDFAPRDRDLCRYLFEAWTNVARRYGFSEYEAPILEGAQGQHCPALLGLKSLQAKKGVLQLDKEKRILTFPGPGGYEINWAPGATHIQLESAPSGHYVIPVDAYDRIPPKAQGLPPKMEIFAASVASPFEARQTPSSSSSQP